MDNIETKLASIQALRREFPSEKRISVGASAFDSFADALKQLITSVERLDREAETAIEKMLTGEPIELHKVMLAVERANLAFQVLIAIRNRLLEAYQELMRMPL